MVSFPISVAPPGLVGWGYFGILGLTPPGYQLPPLPWLKCTTLKLAFGVKYRCELPLSHRETFCNEH